ncbi:hypothetical protein VST7929_01945 [Vibrio stylophorae]|uniref:Transposase n=1 Tax=Vibrio stylophorae TaxID=659351 RepID=A0ABN8DZ27_9VIBR|nr:hypothetical protein VST7929_01945 [Vibrio stylophorae]
MMLRKFYRHQKSELEARFFIANGMAVLSLAYIHTLRL